MTNPSAQRPDHIENLTHVGRTTAITVTEDFEEPPVQQEIVVQHDEGWLKAARG